eukprot:TRINITY_DN113059_c0_g1_i1.p1 TRINITY_DN113059_c0_g1~~TRINITY_DN113059_c0_g1_i1.p1  ORF type:complete len:625 (-),score=56.69 TRINITY_DN113059_c0_g1_i1:208-2037(-)
MNRIVALPTPVDDSDDDDEWFDDDEFDEDEDLDWDEEPDSDSGLSNVSVPDYSMGYGTLNRNDPGLPSRVKLGVSPFGPTLECKICTGNDGVISLACCKKSVCEDCILRWATQCAEENKSLRCVGGCKKKWNGSAFRDKVSAEAWNGLDKLLRQRALACSPDFIHCPNKDCGLGMFISDGPACSWCCCPYCEQMFCFHCGGEWHFGIACDQVKNANTKWKTKNSRPCPYCAASIEKNGGCDSMKCWNCDQEFEWYNAENKQPPRVKDEKIYAAMFMNDNQIVRRYCAKFQKHKNPSPQKGKGKQPQNQVGTGGKKNRKNRKVYGQQGHGFTLQEAAEEYDGERRLPHYNFAPVEKIPEGGGNIVQVSETRFGYSGHFSISKDFCMQFGGFKPGKLVLDESGNFAEVVGVFRSRLWLYFIGCWDLNANEPPAPLQIEPQNTNTGKKGNKKKKPAHNKNKPKSHRTETVLEGLQARFGPGSTYHGATVYRDRLFNIDAENGVDLEGHGLSVVDPGMLVGNLIDKQFDDDDTLDGLTMGGPSGWRERNFRDQTRAYWPRDLRQPPRLVIPPRGRRHSEVERRCNLSVVCGVVVVLALISYVMAVLPLLPDRV